MLEGRISADLLRGHTDTIVLGILMENDAYGYQIYKTIMDRTDGLYQLKEATLYSSYKRLEKEACIVAYWGDESQGGRRKYYRITDKGRAQYKQNIADWAFTQRILNRLLKKEDN
ncbi:PadR family transcriptional regulator [Oceanobacillus jeddahense]|uniref:PadR family transcriptional regulator n=1 Tax=Oceanobacillus jeddahense TaxID=1462527 RepID=UPI000AA30A50